MIYVVVLCVIIVQCKVVPGQHVSDLTRQLTSATMNTLLQSFGGLLI